MSESLNQTDATDSDTQKKTEPKDGLGVPPQSHNLAEDGDSGGSDTGGGGKPKTGLGAAKRGTAQELPDPGTDPKKKTKTGLGTI
jgi:hypothetical protein